MRKLLPRSRMGIFTLVLVLLWILSSLIFTPARSQLLPPGVQFSLSLLTLFLTVLLAVPAVYYSWRLLAVLRRQVLWKIRRRLIVAHFFIGAIPVLLVILILYVSGMLLYYQLSYYLILNQIGIHTGQVHAFNLALRADLEQALANRSTPGGLRAFLEREGKYIFGVYPSASIILRMRDASVGNAIYATRTVRADRVAQYSLPAWLGDREFSGLVTEDVQPEMYQRNGGSEPRRGALYLRSVVFSELRSDNPFSLELSVPLDQHALDRLKAAIGQELLLADHMSASNIKVMLQDTEILRQNVVATTLDMTSEQQFVGRPLWSVLLFPVSWRTGGEGSASDAEVLFVEVSTSRLIQNVFRPESSVSRTILTILQVVLFFLLAVEVVSLVIGILLTKSITNAVYNLDRGTGFIRRGDFSHRIVVKSDDQLGALARSFNQMTEYVQTLVKERVLKERLERELEIAKEVQEQLFPRKAPDIAGVQLTGLCLPARVVSGDYYDFLEFNADRIGLALGDICGKGISAALLMATLQATLRSNVVHLGNNGSSADILQEGAVAGVVKLLNHQIYQQTAANKFASFFLGIYDATRPTLTYCNAGHNPPLFFSRRGVERLTTGGTVVGIFPDAQYEQETVDLHGGNIILAYTDGIVECVNEYGEEFGENRLVELVQSNFDRSADDIQKIIVDRVLDWAFEEERDDDMTLIVGKIL